MQSLGDSYPSRVAERPAITLRQDPVVWSEPGREVSGPLSDYQIKSYAEQGFLFLPELFSLGEVEALMQEIRRLSTDPAVTTRPECITEPKSGDIRSLFAVHEMSDTFARLAAHPQLAGAARQILASDVYIHQSRVNLKPGFRGEAFYWHSDFETWHVEDGMPRMRALSISLLLTDNNAFNGPLMIVPGSHLKFISCVGKTPENHYQHSLKKQEYGVPDEESITHCVQDGGITAPTGRAGSVLIFDCNVLHGSNANMTPWPRSNVFFVYNSVRNSLTAPYSGQQPRPKFIANRHFEPVPLSADSEPVVA